jgi:soluble lytic murein transglycosylase
MSSATRPAATRSATTTRTARPVLAAAARTSAGQARARRTARRRRTIGVLVFVAVLVFFGIRAVSPLFQKAIRDLGLPLQYSTIIRQQAGEKQVDPALVAAVIYAETGFDARTSPAGAMGLMQVEPRTAEALAHESGATNFHISDLGTPAVNIAYGTYYLRELLKNFGGDETAALAAYNGGEGNVDGWITRARQAGHSFGIADIPFPATRAYVTKVMAAQDEYRQKYPGELGL